MVNYVMFLSSSSLSFELLDLFPLLFPSGFPVLMTVGSFKVVDFHCFPLPLELPESLISFETWSRCCSICPQLGLLMFCCSRSRLLMVFLVNRQMVLFNFVFN